MKCVLKSCLFVKVVHFHVLSRSPYDQWYTSVKMVPGMREGSEREKCRNQSHTEIKSQHDAHICTTIYVTVFLDRIV